MPPIAANEAADVLLDLFVVLLAAKIGDEIFKRLDQPGLIGEILAGVVVGPSVLGIVEPGEVLEVFAELGVVFLLFWVGLETRLSQMREVGRTAAAVVFLTSALTTMSACVRALFSVVITCALRRAALSLSVTALGVPLGAYTPCQTTTSNWFRPPSLNVRASGSAATRVSVVVP